MSELCAAVANVQFGKVPAIVEHMRGSNHRIQAALADLPNVTFRRLIDPEGDTGPFIVAILPDEPAALAVVEKLHAAGVEGSWRVADYGLHIYYNVPQLVAKTPLSPAGNPWSLPENADSAADYNKGACPVSDDLFSRSVIVAIPSRLTGEQETQLTEILRKALS